MSRVVQGDCLDVMATLEAGSTGACVTDPPYGLKFMGKAWDHGVPGSPYWSEALRVIKPGGYLLAFGGTRTYHRLTCAIEDAGFEIRDCLMWLHGQGFPKGKGQLKPAWEPIVLARKPGPSPWLNVDGCRIGSGETVAPDRKPARREDRESWRFGDGLTVANPAGRWPANVVLSHEDGCREVGTKQVKSGNGGRGVARDTFGYHGNMGDHEVAPYSTNGRETVTAWECAPDCAVAMLDAQSGERDSGGPSRKAVGYTDQPAGWSGGTNNIGRVGVATRTVSGYQDRGGASRFFYCSKASPSERGAFNDHPTVKPLALMRWLVRLVTPPGGTVLDPFCGSGSTLIAADREGFDAIGIDSDPHAVEIARRRLTDDAGPLFAEAAG